MVVDKKYDISYRLFIYGLYLLKVTKWFDPVISIVNHIRVGCRGGFCYNKFGLLWPAQLASDYWVLKIRCRVQNIGLFKMDSWGTLCFYAIFYWGIGNQRTVSAHIITWCVQFLLTPSVDFWSLERNILMVSTSLWLFSTCLYLGTVVSWYALFGMFFWNYYAPLIEGLFG